MARGRRGARGGRRSGRRTDRGEEDEGAPAPAISCGRDVVGSGDDSDDHKRRRSSNGHSRTRTRTRGRFDDSDDSESSSSDSEESMSSSESSSESESSDSDDSDAGRGRRYRRSRKRVPTQKMVVFGPEGAEFVSEEAPDAGASASSAESTAVVPGWKTVEVVHRLYGSALDFATGAVKPVMVMSDDACGIFDSAKTPEGRSSSQLCGKVEITGCENNSPFTLQLNVDGVQVTGAVRSMTADGKDGILTVFPGQKISEKDLEVMRSKAEGRTVAFVDAFPGVTLDTIDDGIEWLPNGLAKIKKDHPVIVMMTDYYKKMNKSSSRPVKPFTKRMERPRGFFMVHGGTAKKVLEQGRDHLRDDLKETNLYKLGFSWSRAHADASLDEESQRIAADLTQAEVDPDDDEEQAAEITDAGWINGAEMFDGVATDRAKCAKMTAKFAIRLKTRITFKPI